MAGVMDKNGFAMRQSLRAETMHRQARARKEPRFCLRNAAGEYLHWSGSKLTSDRSQAWIGYDHQRECIQRSISLAGALQAVPA